jgi:PPOX class probable FMN-dependent enzyme
MSLAPWRSALARALHRNRALVYARYLQLATVRPDGRPANRTVVFRGFWRDTNQLKFVTDARSEKTAQIERSRWGEICWYFPKTREQFRIAGALSLITADSSDAASLADRQATWQDLSDAARSQFAWADPGKPRTPAECFDVPPPEATTPLPHFCLLLLEPDFVDHLELRGEPQNRWQYQRTQEQWSTQAVNP